MPLKNYTSKQPASRSIEYIERKLVQQGATQILKTYGPDGRLSAICFSMMIGGVEMSFKVPAKVQACEEVLYANLSPRAKPETKAKIPKQAERTAWKIVQDWVEAQMAMIELAQVDIMEVFMPYLYDGSTGQTFFEKMKVSKYKALPGGFSK